ncbi:Gustatory receptor 2a [Carabus blaptoides fortunei]
MFSQLDSIDAQLQQLGQKLEYKGTFWFTVVGVCVTFVELSVTLPSDYVFFLNDESVMFIICSYTPMILYGMIKLQFITFVYLLEKRYAFINKILMRLEQKVEPIGKDDGKIVRDISMFVLKEEYLKEYVNIIKTTYYKMWKLTVWINRIYGLPILISIATTFSIVTKQYYLIYESLSKLAANYSSDQVAPIYFAFQWSSIQIFEVLVFVHYCTKTQNEAQVTPKIIHNLQAKVDNRTIFAQILAAITTYLVVMIQYDLASRSIKELKSNSYNDTFTS